MRLILLLLALATGLLPPAAAQIEVERTFGATIERLSEAGGYFDTDNLISNEASYLHVMGSLNELRLQGGAYLGVGPDQNFSYIAAVRPELAIIVDIRRDNLLEHLLFKALFELSHDRAEYLGLLLARPVPARRSPDAAIETIVAHLDASSFDSRLLASTQERVRRRIRTYGLTLSETDLATIERFHGAFAEAGLNLRFQSHGRAPQYYYPTLRELILERDREGRRAGYLATEEAFQIVRGMQLRNRIVPVIGDLAGDRALPAIAEYLRQRELPVTAYYTSNVEFYLAGGGSLDRFVANLRRLPRAADAVIIRSLFRVPHPQTVPGYQSTQLLQPIEELLEGWDAGRIRSYRELVGR